MLFSITQPIILIIPRKILDLAGRMSFHGGFIWRAAGRIALCKSYRVDYWLIADLVVVTVPIGLGLGKTGQFINGDFTEGLRMCPGQ